ncbi:hypothetical protein SCUP515_07132 [Seiridium cupressi]
MATITALPTSSTHKPSYKPTISGSLASKSTGYVDFDPKVHLAFEEPPKVYTMEELGLPVGSGVSPIAVSEPFQLFTEEAVNRMRQEVLSDEVMNNCQYSSNLAHCQLRGFANKLSVDVMLTFYDTILTRNTETLAIVSKIAGIDLVTEMDLEIAHINLSVKSEEERQKELAAIEERAQFDADEGIGGCPWEDDDPIVGWHRDSYPFVCVTMLSDCTNMVGGETALRIGNGEIMKVRGPQQAR